MLCINVVNLMSKKRVLVRARTGTQRDESKRWQRRGLAFSEPNPLRFPVPLRSGAMFDVLFQFFAVVIHAVPDVAFHMGTKSYRLPKQTLWFVSRWALILIMKL